MGDPEERFPVTRVRCLFAAADERHVAERQAGYPFEPDRPIADAGGLMAAYGIAHLAVTEPRTHRPIGVISTLDIARVVAAGRGSRGLSAV